MLKIAIDCGRSGTKHVPYNLEKKQFENHFLESKHGIIDMDLMCTLPVITFNPSEDLLLRFDDDPKIYAMGATADKFLTGDNVVFATVDEVYVQFSIYYLFTMIFKYYNDDEIHLAINLTFNNYKLLDSIKNKIKGKHVIRAYNTKGKIITEKTFNITKLSPLYQGWASLIDVAIKDDFTSDEKFKSDTLVIDVGNRTVDCIYARQLNILKNECLDLGTTYIFDYIRSKLFANDNLKKTNSEIENAIINSHSFKSNGGIEVNPSKYLNDAIYEVGNKIKLAIEEKFSEYTFENILLTGGGSIYFQSLLKQIWNDLIVMEDPVYTNARGMTKLMQLE